MRICIVGPGRIGTMLARCFTRAGHTVTATFSTDPTASAAALGSAASFIIDGRAAVHDTDAVVVSVPWGAIDAAWRSIGADPGSAVVVDTTNPFGPDGPVPLPATSAAFNARRFGLRSYAKAFNTLTAGFQAAAFERSGSQRAAMFFAASNAHAHTVAAALIEAVGFVPVCVGGPAESEIMEAPRRPGAVYGEEYTPDGARAAVEAFRRDRPIPAPPGS